MRLKILYVPVAVVIILVVIILNIKPDYAVIQSKRAEIALKQTEVGGMDKVISNISSLEGNIDSKKESEEFLYQYLPRAVDPSRIIDSFNYLSQQTGVALATIEIIQVKEEASDEQLFPVNAAALTSLNPNLGPPGSKSAGDMGMMPALSQERSIPMPVPKKLILKVAIEGSYSNTVEFITRVSRIDRANAFNMLQIESKVSEGDGETVINTTNPILSSIFEIRLDYLPVKIIDSALNVATFSRDTYNFSPLAEAKAWVTNPLPVLDNVKGGKSNPFEG